MGEFTHTLVVSDVNGVNSVAVEALVDTGATYSIIPADMLRGLGIVPERTVAFELADRSEVEYGLGSARFEVLGVSGVAPVAFGDDDAEPIMGAVTLEALMLMVDPIAQELVPRARARALFALCM